MNERKPEEMVERVPWMAPVDYEVMLFFENHDIEASPKVVSANIDYDRQYVSKRMGELAEAGLIETTSAGLYGLTDLGRDYLAGKIDADQLEREE